MFEMDGQKKKASLVCYRDDPEAAVTLTRLGLKGGIEAASHATTRVTYQAG